MSESLWRCRCSSVDDSGEDVGIARVLNGQHANSVHSGDGGAYIVNTDSGLEYGVSGGSWLEVEMG